jgi:hypothetical protein
MVRLLTACKQYCLAAGATQGNIAYTQTVMRYITKFTTEKQGSRKLYRVGNF